IGALSHHAGLAHALAGLLAAFPVHAARGQLYIPLEILARHGADRQGVKGPPATPQLLAALAELRARARRHLGAAQGLLPTAAPAASAAPVRRRPRHARALAGRARGADARPHGAARLRSIRAGCDRAVAATVAHLARGAAAAADLPLKRKSVAQVAAIGEDARHQGALVVACDQRLD